MMDDWSPEDWYAWEMSHNGRVRHNYQSFLEYPNKLIDLEPFLLSKHALDNNLPAFDKVYKWYYRLGYQKINRRFRRDNNNGR